MKSIAVLMGYGPDTEFLLQNRNLIPDEVELFRLNVRSLRREEHGLPLLNPITWDVTISMLKERGLSQVVTFGSLAFRVTNATGLFQASGSYAKFWELLPHIMGRFSSSDAGRLHILSKLEAEFGFPPLIKVLPCLFANEDVAVNPDDELLERTLEDARSHNKDALVEVDRVPVKVFRVPKGPRRNLFNRRLDPAKLRAIREGQKTRHFFFDRHRTTLVDVEEMKAYALANALTLQSFTDGD